MGLIDSLCSLPAGDVNYTSALNKATKAQLQLAVKIMKMNSSGHHQTRIEACEKKIKSFEETKDDKKVEQKVNPKPANTITSSKAARKAIEKEPEKIVEFPGTKPKIKPLAKSEEHHTYEECEKKILEETKAFTDEDNRFVIQGILDKCKEDEDFRNNVCLKEKSYIGFLEYMIKAAAEGYCIMLGKTKGMLSKEKALDLAFDYYNMLEIIKPEEKKKVAEKLTKEVNKIAEEVKAEPQQELLMNFDADEDEEEEKSLTWDDIYARADGCACGSAELTAKDNARYEVANLVLERKNIDIEKSLIPEEKVDHYTGLWNIRFDENGKIIHADDEESELEEEETGQLKLVF